MMVKSSFNSGIRINLGIYSNQILAAVSERREDRQNAFMEVRYNNNLTILIDSSDLSAN